MYADKFNFTNQNEKNPNLFQSFYNRFEKQIKWTGRAIFVIGKCSLIVIIVFSKFIIKVANFPLSFWKFNTFKSLYNEKNATNLNGWNAFTQEVRIEQIARRVVLSSEMKPVVKTTFLGSLKTGVKIDHVFQFINYNEVNLTLIAGDYRGIYTIKQEGDQIVFYRGKEELLTSDASSNVLKEIQDFIENQALSLSSKKKNDEISNFVDWIEDREEFLKMNDVDPLFMRETLHYFYHARDLLTSFFSPFGTALYMYNKKVISNFIYYGNILKQGVVIYPATLHDQVNVAAKCDREAKCGKSPKYHTKEGDYILAMRKRRSSKHQGFNVKEYIISKDGDNVVVKYLNTDEVIVTLSEKEMDEYFYQLLEKLQNAPKHAKFERSDFSAGMDSNAPGAKTPRNIRKRFIKLAEDIIEKSKSSDKDYPQLQTLKDHIQTLKDHMPGGWDEEDDKLVGTLHKKLNLASHPDKTKDLELQALNSRFNNAKREVDGIKNKFFS